MAKPLPTKKRSPVKVNTKTKDASYRDQIRLLLKLMDSEKSVLGGDVITLLETIAKYDALLADVYAVVDEQKEEITELLERGRATKSNVDRLEQGITMLRKRLDTARQEKKDILVQVTGILKNLGYSQEVKFNIPQNGG